MQCVKFVNKSAKVVSRIARVFGGGYERCISVFAGSAITRRQDCVLRHDSLFRAYDKQW